MRESKLKFSIDKKRRGINNRAPFFERFRYQFDVPACESEIIVLYKRTLSTRRI